MRDCSYDVHERGRQWTTGRESLKGMASVGWQDGRRERGKYATAERDKCGRTNRWWLTGSFIHYSDQIQQDSPPYGMAQLIHPITWTTYTTRGEGMVCVCVCVCAGEKVPGGFLNMTVNERGSEENKAATRSVINLVKAQRFEQIKKTRQNCHGNKKQRYKTCMICLFGIIKTDQLIQTLCDSPMMIRLTAFFPLNYIQFTSKSCPRSTTNFAFNLTIK